MLPQKQVFGTGGFPRCQDKGHKSYCELTYLRSHGSWSQREKDYELIKGRGEQSQPPTACPPKHSSQNSRLITLSIPSETLQWLNVNFKVKKSKIHHVTFLKFIMRPA